MIDTFVLPYHSEIDRSSACKELITLLDVGGEGRFPLAINLNPSPIKTLGPTKGQPIARRLHGRADAIPLPPKSVRVLLMERTPLLRSGVLEIQRVVLDGGFVILRHHFGFANPHRIADQILGPPISATCARIGKQAVHQSVYNFSLANRRKKTIIRHSSILVSDDGPITFTMS